MSTRPDDLAHRPTEAPTAPPFPAATGNKYKTGQVLSPLLRQIVASKEERRWKRRVRGREKGGQNFSAVETEKMGDQKEYNTSPFFHHRFIRSK
jgi:hypothetical protein